MRLIIAIVVLSVQKMAPAADKEPHSNVKARYFLASDDGTTENPVEIAPLGDLQFAVSGPLADSIGPGFTLELPLEQFHGVRRDNPGLSGDNDSHR